MCFQIMQVTWLRIILKNIVRVAFATPFEPWSCQTFLSYSYFWWLAFQFTWYCYHHKYLFFINCTLIIIIKKLTFSSPVMQQNQSESVDLFYIYIAPEWFEQNSVLLLLNWTTLRISTMFGKIKIHQLSNFAFSQIPCNLPISRHCVVRYIFLSNTKYIIGTYVWLSWIASLSLFVSTIKTASTFK